MKCQKACAVVAKPGGTATPRVAEMAHHLAERRILPADERDIGTPEFLEPDHLVCSRGHRILHVLFMVVLASCQ